MSNNKNYTIEKIEKSEQVLRQANGNIALSSIFAIGGFALAGVAFGLELSTLLAFTGVGITSASIKNLRDNIKLKSTAKEQLKGKTKW